ncbi:MAG: TIR domain-containing protein [Geminicoccaceae bacterium]
MASVFVSYSRVSQPVVQALVEDIEALGHDVWFDQELSGGQNWWDQILDKIRGCDVFIFAVAPDALESTACKREADYADNLGKPVLPILVDDGVSTSLLPAALSRIQFVDYRKQDRDAALSLGRAFSSLPPAKPLPEPLPIPPDAPISYLATLAERVSAATSLDYEDQSGLIIDLKRVLRDSDTADDSRTLLMRLRKRDDLFAKIAEEIDEILSAREQAELAEPSRPFVQEEQNVSRVEPGRERNSEIADRQDKQHDKIARNFQIAQATVNDRLNGALTGAITGALICWISIVLDGKNRLESWPLVLVASIGWLIAGAIARMCKPAVLAALSGATLGWLSIAIGSDAFDAISGAGFVGAPIGAIAGAILGIILAKRISDSRADSSALHSQQ